MTLDALTELVADLAALEETDLRALIAATAAELARRRGHIRAGQDLAALARHVASPAGGGQTSAPLRAATGASDDLYR